MAEVIRLAVSQPKPVRACATCRYGRDLEKDLHYAKCAATGDFINFERRANWGGICGPEGRLWEPRPPRTLGIFERAWRFLFGGY
jgi:hypothetical protein